MKYLEEKDFIISTILDAVKLKEKIKISPSHKGNFDYVTELDKAVELKIVEDIHNKYPFDNIYGEEYTHDEIKDRTWVIDPIDGTCNMVRGIPIYGTQVALVDNNEIVLSVIYDINSSSVFVPYGTFNWSATYK